MTTSPSNIRALRPEYSVESTARKLEYQYQPGVRPRHTGGDSEASTRRDQLKVISGQLKRAPIGYSIFVLSIPVIALLVVLVVNIVLSNRQYELVELNAQLTGITQTNEALAQQLSQKSAPQAVAQQAADMGMVLPGTTASIDLSSGEIVGTATAAEAENTPTSFVAKPTVRSSTGIPAEVELPAHDTSDPVTVTNGEVPGPESNTVKIIEPQVSLPPTSATNSTSQDGVADTIQTSSVGSLQGPKISLPTDN
ncbi:hypothetical protein [Enteractinococcus coprophilus]|uniref:Cell division protein FtsL n=1 Tax=Enteractinococcus coprophilus TaxID=1027633 RepID=A0A543AJZ6_9MICC|nr:hypothetical protein [Enteractinococcus coprophilus]TQL72846.1 hypothetical protein FB556_1515 [Enteractinococcus coprophilus]